MDFLFSETGQIMAAIVVGVVVSLLALWMMGTRDKD